MRPRGPGNEDDVTPIELHAEEATEFFIICEHDLSTFDKLLNNVLDFIGYDRIMYISNLGKANLCLHITDVNKHTVYVTEQFSSRAVMFVLINLSILIYLQLSIYLLM